MSNEIERLKHELKSRKAESEYSSQELGNSDESKAYQRRIEDLKLQIVAIQSGSNVGGRVEFGCSLNN